jgi:diguanylate cyclase (GGDEF)-like protein/PAS domain S-box-containing protein
MVTGLREGKQQLAEKNHRLQTTVNELAATNHILANAVEGIAQIDENGHLTNANSSFANMHEYDMGRLSGCHWQALIAQEDHAQVQDAIDQAHPQRKSACEAQGRRSDGSLFHQEIVVVASGGPNPLTYHWFVRDISERKKLESEIQYQAFHDPLTGLPNRALFVDRLDMACKRASRKGEGIAVLFLDLDDFKIINDTMGHEAGDHLLAAIASRIQRSIRPQDTAARLGGDEFTVLLDGLECVEEAVHVAERILSGLEAPISLPTGKTFAGTSIGIAFCKGGNYDSDTLLHNADVAMYQAKCVPASTYAVFEPAMNDPAVERRELANALRVALNRDELSLHYQPIVNLHSGETLMVEALLRWRDPVRGDVPPSMFVAVAEEAGLMDMLGSWSLNHACKQMREWLDSIPETRKLIMSVNVSGKQLQRPDLNDTVRAALSEYGLPPEKLCLEVAAKLLPTDGERTLSLIKKLKETGVKLAIDDFGTGSHLISKLSEYPFDMVKIDGSITWMLESHEEARALVQAMMLMAKPAGVEVTAEGIETPGQLEYLREAGCTIGQGYIFGKALPAVEVVDYVRRKLLPGDDISSEFAA